MEEQTLDFILCKYQHLSEIWQNVVLCIDRYERCIINYIK